jgi:imidazoleglycerol-phosphate dehydratase
MNEPPRRAEVERATAETRVAVSLDLDGTGAGDAATGIPFFDHMLEQLGRHSGFDLSVRADGDLQVDAHHTVEDVGLAVGEALAKALGEKAGIRRFGSVAVPLDEALVEVAVDLSGRPFVVHDVPVPAELIGSYDPGLTEDFIRALATAGAMTVHVRLVSGRAPHHIVEAEFKALARALGDACLRIGPADQGPPSTKGIL